MNLLPDAAPHEQNVDASYLKKWFDNQDLLLLIRFTERTLRKMKKAALWIYKLMKVHIGLI